MEVVTDSEGKILARRTFDGAAFENVSFTTPKMSIDGHIIENIEDPEGRSEITIDSEGKIISFRTEDNTLNEFKLKVFESFELGEKAKNIYFENYARKFNKRSAVRKFNLPSYGFADIVEETFFLSADERYSTKNDIYPIQVYENNTETAIKKIVCVLYYIKTL